MIDYFKIILRGIGQVMLQNNALTGLLFLVGIFYNSWIMGLGSIIGVIISTYSAYLFKYKKDDIENGLYGFNGVLVGIAIYFFFGLNLISTIFVILGSIFSTVIMYQMKRIIPAFTAPFVISTWIVFLIIKFLDIIPFLNSSLDKVNSLNTLSSVSMGFGQVMFQGSIITGIIFFIAILVNSRKAAVYAIYGSILGVLFALIFSLPISMINIGLFGYNAVLSAIALGDKNWKAFIFASIAILLSVLINYGLGFTGVITLTAPFVLATWIALFIKDKKLFITNLQIL